MGSQMLTSNYYPARSAARPNKAQLARKTSGLAENDFDGDPSRCKYSPLALWYSREKPCQFCELVLVPTLGDC